MSRHLHLTHNVENVQERRLLLQLASGRVNVRGSECPVQACSYGSGRLDRHLFQGHPELSSEVRSKMLDFVRRSKTVELLRALMETEPSPPLTSGLSMEGCSSTDWEEQEEDGGRAPPPPTSSQPASSDEEGPGPSAPPNSPVDSARESHASEQQFPASLGKPWLSAMF